MRKIPESSSWFLLILIFLKNSFLLHAVQPSILFCGISRSYNLELMLSWVSLDFQTWITQKVLHRLCKMMPSHKYINRFYISQKYWQSWKTKGKLSDKPVNTHSILLFHHHDCCACGNLGHKGQNDKLFSESQLWKNHLNVGLHFLLMNFIMTPVCEPYQEDANKELRVRNLTRFCTRLSQGHVWSMCCE